jgi:hypothetical protein
MTLCVKKGSDKDEVSTRRLIFLRSLRILCELCVKNNSLNYD